MNISQSKNHISVLLNESVDGLAIKSGDIVIDCTLGSGGHTSKFLQAVGSTGRVISIDRDPTAIASVAMDMATSLQDGRLTLINAPFSQLTQELGKMNLHSNSVSTIFADIGVSSMQLDQADRGFSFMHSGPLDMRMNQQNIASSSAESTPTAAEIVNTLDVQGLTNIFREFGEEPRAWKLAQAIVQARPQVKFTDTLEFAEFVKKALNYPKDSRKHPATRVFQALRIAVNEELRELEKLIAQALDLLKPNGRLGIITFHSLEDRIVKNAFQSLSGQKGRQLIPKGLPIVDAEVHKMSGSQGEILKPFPITPSSDELAANPRSRSAKLRIFQKKTSP